MQLEDKISQLPQKPGVYQYKDTSGKIIYVGKAIKLKNRVKSYFRVNGKKDAKTKALIEKIADLEVIVTDSEAEALILEDSLIKKLKPRYNINLKDDKSYPYIRVTNEPYPRIFMTRTIIKDGSKYFGPYTELRNLKPLLRTINKIFKIRSCNLQINSDSIKKKKHKICLDYHIGKCDGPCEGLIPYEEYRENIELAKKVLSGKTKDLERIFEEKMIDLADNLKFEEAAKIRDNLDTLRDYSSRQKIVSTELIDRDIFGISREDDKACTLVFTVREGKLIGRKHFILNKAIELSDEEILERSIESWYANQDYIPKEILIPFELTELDTLSTFLTAKKESSVHIRIPKIGDNKKLVDMAIMNAKYNLKDYLISITKREQSITRPVMSLQRDLRLKNVPRIIECFDNSHLQGEYLVSSMVQFIDGKPAKSNYRKFKNKTVNRNDDFAAMREAVFRRYSRLVEENQKLPDLIVIDGGKGQLSSAVSALEELKLINKIEIIGLAKKLEEVFFPGKSESILLPKSSSSLILLQQIRDEAHRFAITFHRQLRNKNTLRTELTNIKGIGEKTAKELLKKFSSLENIKNAKTNELETILNKKQILNLIDWKEKLGI